MKFLLISLLIIYSINLIDAKISTKCPESRIQAADECAKKGFFLMNPEYDGHQGKSADTYCQTVSETVQCIDKFNKECLKGFTKQAATIGLTGMKKHYKSICGKNAPKKAEFLQKTKWLDRTHIDQLYPCVGASIRNMNEITDKVKSEEQIPQSCCNYIMTRSCLNKKIKSMTNEANRKFIEQLANESLSNLVDFLCSGYSQLNTCKSKLPEPMKRLAATYKNPSAGKEKFSSFLIPFLDILTD